MPKVTVEEIITDKIVSMLEKGEIPWHKPWVGTQSFAYNRISAKTAIRANKPIPAYSFLNQIMLDKPGEWASFKQWNDEGATVKKGEKSSICVWWSQLSYPQKDENGKIVLDENGNQVMKKYWKLRYYSVFHISQVVKADKIANEDGTITFVPTDESMIPVIKDEALPCVFEPIEQAEIVFHDYLDRNKIAFEEYGDSAFYAPAQDKIVLPPKDCFKSTVEYYSTAFHEATHSTGHESRLNRLTKTASFGSAVYSKEQLCAEIGAASCMHRLGIETASTLQNSAAYCQSWLKALKNDKKMLASAATKAEKAVHLIFGEQDKIATE